ncbi:hypothetical protein [Streptomyces sp. 7N604]
MAYDRAADATHDAHVATHDAHVVTRAAVAAYGDVGSAAGAATASPAP